MGTELKDKLSQPSQVKLARDIDFAKAAEMLHGKVIFDKEEIIGVSWGSGFSIVWRESGDRNDSRQLAFSDKITNGSTGKIVSTRYITNWGLAIINSSELALVHPPVEKGYTQGYYLNRSGIQDFRGSSFIFSDAIKAAEKATKQAS